MLAQTPTPPYYAVIFTSVKNEEDKGYSIMADLMVELASQQDGFLGIETARNDLGVTVSYWRDADAIKKWKAHADHQIAQKKGKTHWYKQYKVRIAKVERDYDFGL
ncbi:antibiotic biosynthesis monooxygenase [Tamlana crocina]